MSMSCQGVLSSNFEHHVVSTDSVVDDENFTIYYMKRRLPQEEQIKGARIVGVKSSDSAVR